MLFVVGQPLPGRNQLRVVVPLLAVMITVPLNEAVPLRKCAGHDRLQTPFSRQGVRVCAVEAIHIADMRCRARQ